MAGSKAFRVAIVGDIKDATRSLKSMEKKTSALGKGLKVLGGAFAAGVAIDKVTAAVTSSIDRAEEMNSLYATTETIMANMGDRVGQTADQVKEANAELSRVTGVDKAQITEATNVLLTFGQIGGEAFSRAKVLALDMSTVFGGDASSSATQLAKALEDPVKGIGALSRVGVTFTDSQKEMIASMVEAGDVAGAQALILDTLETQVGGTAEASADATAKIANMGKDAQEWLGNKLLPIIEKIAEWLVEEVVPAFKKVADWISKHVPPWYDEYVKPTVESIRELITSVLDFVRRFWDRWGTHIMAILKAWWDVVSTYVGFVWDILKGLIDFVSAVFRGDWEAAWQAVLSIVGAFVDFFKEMPGKILGYIASIVSAVGSLAADIGRGLVNGIISAWNALDLQITIGGWKTPFGTVPSWTTPDLFPDLPLLARGGIVSGPTLAMIGEAGPEAVVPLGSSGFGNTYNVTVQTGVGDPVTIGRAVVDAIDRYEQVAGSTWRTA